MFAASSNILPTAPRVVVHGLVSVWVEIQTDGRTALPRPFLLGWERPRLENRPPIVAQAVRRTSPGCPGLVLHFSTAKTV
jgi:hypothetical protein